MKTIRALTVGLALCACAVWAEDRLVVQRVQVTGANGSVNGKLTLVGDRMIFVDDDRPEASFVIPKSSFRHGKAEGGRLTLDVTPAYTSPWGSQSNLVLVMPNQTSAGDVVTWVGVPVEGMTGEASRAVAVMSPGTTTTVDNVTFDVKNGDQRGKLIVRDDAVSFESLSDATHSRRWAYSDIKELTKDSNEVKIEPYHGSKYEFQFVNPAMRDTVYNMLSDKIVAATQGVRH